MENTTICAIATGKGGAIGIIRVSGIHAIEYTNSIFHSARQNYSLLQAKPYTLNFGSILDNDGNTIDEVLVSVFHAPHSYTGENATEISCHNSPYIVQKILQLLIENGCQLAAPGEYTQRAFLNGKLELSQAEAVADLIASTTASSHRLAMRQLKNGFTKEFRALRDKLLKISSLMELELDFSDHEELEFADRSDLLSLLAEIKNKISHLSDSFKYGNAIKQGIPVAIIGETNVGKSTLLNTLLGEEKAIVSDIHGTTRDVIEDTININGYLFRFIDTAGIRNTDNTIEKIGIERTFQKMEQASIILCIVDATENIQENDILSQLPDKPTLILFNKCDLLTPEELNMFSKKISNLKYQHLNISAKNNINIDTLKEKLLSLADIPQSDENEFTVTNLRHYEALKAALQCAQNADTNLQNGIPTDLVSEDLRQCLYHLSEIIGEVTTTDVLHNIFKNFCIGK